jgi:hypothetical protein
VIIAEDALKRMESVGCSIRVALFSGGLMDRRIAFQLGQRFARNPPSQQSLHAIAIRRETRVPHTGGEAPVAKFSSEAMAR